MILPPGRYTRRSLSSPETMERSEIVLRHRAGVDLTSSSVRLVAVDGHCQRSGKTGHSKDRVRKPTV
jgi:hypothetical protein